MNVLIIISILIAGYVLGSLASAVWIGKIFYGIDVRQHGSGNAGATNTLRVLGRRAALPVFLIDAGKGYAAVALAELAPLDDAGLVYLRIALVVLAVVGHIFPVFTRFKGGKGVATITGCLLSISPIPVLCCFVVFVVVLAISHYVSLGSMIGGCLYPVFMYLVEGERSLVMVLFSVVVAGLLLFTHRKNIGRLRAGTESKIYLFRRSR